MIVYDLKCVCGHGFEAWFRDSAGFESQCEGGEIDCPLCGSVEISKALMAPNISLRNAGRKEDDKAGVAEAVATTLTKLRHHVEGNCDYVGDKFAEEARKIHYGETKPRGIFGEATKRESDELRDEGVDFTQIPAFPRHDA